ncbi:MAG: glycosyltransferase family A protein [Candidatus ainarchaeum sp.]|nr:glycosyltransferase family A protein [Candidatus ainarchaeum sp.]
MGFFRMNTRKIIQFFGIKDIKKAKVNRFVKSINKKTPKLFLKNQKIAIVVPCYGHEQVLESTFNSIINQIEKPDEVIFVVDKSLDNSYNLLKKLEKNSFFKKVKVIFNKKNVGQAESINIGVKNSKSPLIMVLNDDDFLMKDAISIVKKIFKRNPTFGLVGFGSILAKSDEEVIRNAKSSDYSKNNSIIIKTPLDASKYENYNDINMTHSGSTFSRLAWKHINGYFPKKNRIVNFSDRDFQIRVNLFFDIGISSIPICFYRNYCSVDAGKNS